MPNAEFRQLSIEDIVIHMQRLEPPPLTSPGHPAPRPSAAMYAFRRSSSNKFQIPPEGLPSRGGASAAGGQKASSSPSSILQQSSSNSLSRSVSKGRSLRRALTGTGMTLGAFHWILLPPTWEWGGEGVPNYQFCGLENFREVADVCREGGDGGLPKQRFVLGDAQLFRLQQIPLVGERVGGRTRKLSRVLFLSLQLQRKIPVILSSNRFRRTKFIETQNFGRSSLQSYFKYARNFNRILRCASEDGACNTTGLID